MLTLVLLLTLLPLVASQRLDSNGCIADGGFFNATSRLCECESGYEGVGDLCCSDTTDIEHCFLIGDPYLRSVKDQVVFLNIPCAVCIAVVDGFSSDGRTCMWEVLASSTIQERGIMYTSNLKVGISINKASAEYISFDQDAPNNPVNFIKRDGTVEPVTFDPAGVANLEVDSENVTVTFDLQAGVMILEACGNRVVYRPHRIQGQYEHRRQPGMCLRAPQGSIRRSVESGNICSLDSSYNTDIPTVYSVMNDALNTRLTFSPEQARSHPDYDATCHDVIDAQMSMFCQGISKEALAQCAPVLTNQKIRTCLVAAGLSGPEVAKLFGLCLEAFCYGPVEKCNQLKASTPVQVCMPSFLTCDQWQQL